MSFKKNLKELCELSQDDATIINELAEKIIVTKWPQGKQEQPQAVFKFAFECFSFLRYFITSIGKKYTST